MKEAWGDNSTKRVVWQWLRRHKEAEATLVCVRGRRGSTVTDVEEMEKEIIHAWSAVLRPTADATWRYANPGDAAVGDVEISAEMLMSAAEEAKPTAAGPDGWLPKHLKKADGRLMASFAKILNAVEAGLRHSVRW